MCKILRVKKTHFFDVFNGEGWKEHTRVHWDGTKLDVVSGIRLTRYQKFLVESNLRSISEKAKEL